MLPGDVLDAPDVAELARFYPEPRGWVIGREGEDNAALDSGEAVAHLSIQRNPDYVRPVWPGEEGSQQMMLHLDFEVTELDAEVARAVHLGAELPGHQPQENVRVLLDPAGHPICLYPADKRTTRASHGGRPLETAPAIVWCWAKGATT